jgi:hypothetical protein
MSYVIVLQTFVEITDEFIRTTFEQIKDNVYLIFILRSSIDAHMVEFWQSLAEMRQHFPS